LSLLTDVEGDVKSLAGDAEKAVDNVKKVLDNDKALVLKFSKNAVKHILKYGDEKTKELVKKVGMKEI